MTTDFDNEEIYDTSTGQTIADLEMCCTCEHRKINREICSTDRGEQDLSYPYCEINKCKFERSK